jgi:hypothetical protein
MYQIELDYHTLEEYKLMNTENSYKAIEIIQAYMKGLPILLRYKFSGSRWFKLTDISHLDWNFSKYEYKLDNKDKTEDEIMEEIYKKELGSSFESVDRGVCLGKTDNLLL